MSTSKAVYLVGMITYETVFSQSPHITNFRYYIGGDAPPEPLCRARRANCKPTPKAMTPHKTAAKMDRISAYRLKSGDSIAVRLVTFAP